MIKILPTTLADIENIYALEQSCFTADAWTKESFEFCLENAPVHKLFSAFYENEFAGYIATSCVLDEMAIDSIAVAPSFRGKGVAKALIEKAVEGFSGSCYLEVRASNQAAQNLYLSCGFEIAAVRKNYYEKPTENAVLMIKNIN